MAGSKVLCGCDFIGISVGLFTFTLLPALLSPFLETPPSLGSPKPLIFVDLSFSFHSFSFRSVIPAAPNIRLFFHCSLSSLLAVLASALLKSACSKMFVLSPLAAAGRGARGGSPGVQRSSRKRASGAFALFPAGA